MKLSNVIEGALASCFVWIAAFVLCIIFNAILGTSLYNVIGTFLLFTTWVSGIGFLQLISRKE